MQINRWGRWGKKRYWWEKRDFQFPRNFQTQSYLSSKTFIMSCNCIAKVTQIKSSSKYKDFWHNAILKAVSSQNAYLTYFNLNHFFFFIFSWWSEPLFCQGALLLLYFCGKRIARHVWKFGLCFRTSFRRHAMPSHRRSERLLLLPWLLLY